MKLSDLIDFNPKRPLEKGVIAPFVEMAGLPEGEREIAQIGAREFSGGGSRFSNGDTLFARITPCLENGKTAKVSGLDDTAVAHGSTEFIVMSAKDKEYDEDFVYYLARLPEFRAFAKGRMEGTSGRQRVSWQALADFEINDIDKCDRKEIGGILSSLDNRIAINRRVNKTLEEMARALFKGWFIDTDTDGWPTARLDEHLQAYRGLSYKGNGLCKSGEGVPMHNLNSVYEGGGYKYSGIKFYKGEFKERHVIGAGDIIVTNTEQGHEHRLIGFPAIVPACFGSTGIFSQHIYRVVPLGSSYLTREFLYYLLMAPKVREQIIGATNGSTVNMLAIQGLQVSTFELPPENLVNRFTETVRPIWLMAERNQEQIRTLSMLRTNLLPKLVSGDLRIKDTTHLIGNIV